MGLRLGWRLAPVVLALMCLGMAVTPCHAVDPPTLDWLWVGQAHFALDAEGIPDMAFVRMMWEQDALGNPEIWCYHWKWQQMPDGSYYLATGRARSPLSLGNRCGLDWIFDSGYALPSGVTERWAWDYYDTSLSHIVGRMESDGWSANVAQDSEGVLSYGPYTTAVQPGKNDAAFYLMIDNNTANSENVCWVDVYDATTGTQLGQRYIRRNEFSNSMVYQKFHLNFTVPGWNHALEFRVYFMDRAYIKLQHIGVAQGWIGSDGQHWDNYNSTFPGVWKDTDGMYYMVYEGAGYQGGSPGDIGLASSADGITFWRNATNPCLVHNTTGWERGNIGTPSLLKMNGLWYLYYHGFDTYDCQIGVATGANLLSLTKAANPILPTRPGTWESGTTGKRSNLIQDPGSGLFYMAYEGSTDQNPTFGDSIWSTGIARSSNLINWDRYAGNPVIPRTTPIPGVDGSGMGQDGPELIQIPNAEGKLVTYLYVNTACPRPWATSQKRYRLVWN